LLPVLVAAALASEGRFGLPTASGPLASLASQPGPLTLVVTPGAVATSITTSSGAPAQPQPTATTPAAAAQPTAAPAAQAETAAPRTSSQATAQTDAATAAPAQNTQTETGGPYRAYRVQAGDTVKFVASMFGVSTASVAQASGLQDPDKIRIGQVLTIPAQPGWLYRVQPGENLDQIAARTGVSSQVIADASQLRTASVRAGDVILIPDLSAARNK
jgi:LysM repeat protein